MGLISKLWVKLGLDNKEFKKGLTSSEKSTNRFSNSIKKIGGLIAGAFAVDKLIQFGKELVNISREAVGVTKAFNRISTSRDLDVLRRSVNGTVSDLELMKRAVSANNFGIPLKSLASLFEFAAKRAQDTGESVDYLVNSIVTGIGRKSPLILDNLGITTVQLNKKLEAIGGTAQASIEQLAYAVGSIAEDSLKQTGRLAEDTGTAIERMNASWMNLKTTLSESVAPAAATAANDMNSFLNVLNSDKLNFWDKLSATVGVGLIIPKEWQRIVDKMNAITETAADLTDEQLSKAIESAVKNMEAAMDNLDYEAVTHFQQQLKELSEEEAKRAKKLDSSTKGNVGLIEALEEQLKGLEGAYKSATTISELQSLASQIEDTKNKLEELNIAAKYPLSKAPSFPGMTGKTGGTVDSAIGGIDASIIIPEFPEAASAEFISQYGIFIDQVNSKTGELYESFVNIGQVLEDFATDAIISGAQAVGEALANGENPLEAGGKAMVGALGNFMVDFGGLMVSTGLAKVLNDKLVAIPGAGLPMVIAGTALIAAGQAVATKAAAKDAGFSGGGATTTATAAPEFQITSSRPGDYPSTELTGEIIIKGNDLIAVMKSAQNKLNRT